MRFRSFQSSCLSQQGRPRTLCLVLSLLTALERGGRSGQDFCSLRSKPTRTHVTPQVAFAWKAISLIQVRLQLFQAGVEVLAKGVA
jgi:hypothetical protein